LSTTGTNGNDTLTGTSGSDTISGGNGNDTIFGGGGADSLSGDNGNDTIDGGAGNDSVSGGNGDDSLDGGAGSDHVTGGNGNDTAVYVAIDNLNATDAYEGGKGTDTLVLKLTRAQLDEMNASTVFADFRTANPNAVFDFSTYRFSFNMKLTATGFEQIGTVVIADPAPPVANADSKAINEDGTSNVIAGNVLANDTAGGIADPVLSVVSAGVLIGLYGTLTLNADGSYSYVLDQTNLVVGALNDGDALHETFSYTITDGYGHATSALTITINGHTDILPLFTSGNDVVDFNNVVAGTYVAGTQYDGLGGNDTVILPANAAEAAEAGYVPSMPFHTGDGDNTVFGGALNDVIVGGSGSDTFDGGGGNDRLIGGDGNDTLIGGLGDDILDGGAGNDTFIGGEGSDRLDGGSGINLVVYQDSNIAVDVRLDIGVMRKGFGPDATGLDFLSNIQNVVGSRFADRITGDDHDNALFGGGGDDTVLGGGGNDRLDGGAGRDILSGEVGDDLFISDALNNSMDGGAGNDTVDYSGVLFDLQIDLLLGSAGFPPLRSVYPADYPFLPDMFFSIENVIGSKGNDFIVGDHGDNRITGFLGNDTLRGLDGRDVFHFDLSDGANVGNDIIVDFEIGIDHISLGGGLHHDLADLNAQQVGEDTVLELGPGMRLTLWHTNASLLSNSDFMF
jgi:VCBS repeat-containing protein